MVFRVPVAPVLLALLLVAAMTGVAFPPARAAEGMAWQFFEGPDIAQSNRMTARLVYGVPETDNVQVQAHCAKGGGDPVIILGADTGALEKGAATTLRFSGGGSEITVDGTVYQPEGGEGVAGVRLELDRGATLWADMTEKDRLDYQVPGYGALTLELANGHRQIGNFLDACRAYAGASKAQTTAEASTPASSGESESSDVPEKEAFEAAKELGTIEAWEAFLENYPSGFRADLARAYVKRIATEEPEAPAAPPAPPALAAPAAPPPSQAAPSTPADIAITHTANQGICNAGAPCGYTIVATNQGGEPFNGQLVIANTLNPADAELTYSGPPPWQCEEMDGGAICSHPAPSLAPGQSTTLSLTFTLDDDADEAVNSCAQISWGGRPSATGVRDVQQALNARGFNAGPVDGAFGRRTGEAIFDYQARQGLIATGEIDPALLVSLFTTPGPGDANSGNDRACAGSGVQATPAAAPAPPRPQAARCIAGQVRARNGDCVCPGATEWNGSRCAARQVTQNCSGGRYYSKSRRMCVCPSARPHWYNNRCNTARDCPGDSVWNGRQCVKENDAGPGPRPRPGPPSRPRPNCPGDSVWNGRQCVKENDAGPGSRPRPQPVAPNPALQLLNQIDPCTGGRVRVGTKCKCPGNLVFNGQVCERN